MPRSAWAGPAATTEARASAAAEIANLFMEASLAPTPQAYMFRVESAVRELYARLDPLAFAIRLAVTHKPISRDARKLIRSLSERDLPCRHNRLIERSWKRRVTP